MPVQAAHPDFFIALKLQNLNAMRGARVYKQKKLLNSQQRAGLNASIVINGNLAATRANALSLISNNSNGRVN